MHRLPIGLLAVLIALALTGATLFAASWVVPSGLSWLESLSPRELQIYRVATIVVPIVALLIVLRRRRREGEDAN
jgi:hypothetical protein